VRVQVLAHSSVVAKQLAAALHHQQQHNIISIDNTRYIFNSHLPGLVWSAGDPKVSKETF